MRARWFSRRSAPAEWLGLAWLLAGGLARAQPSVPSDGATLVDTSAPVGDSEPDDSFVADSESSNGFALAAEEVPSLELSGFADFTYAALIGVDDTSWPDAYLQAPSFYIGNLNLYLSGQLSRRIRSLVELRFMYLPQGQLQREGEPIVIEELGTSTPGALTYTDTGVSDYSEFGREVNWGGIRIERAWVEYSLAPYLTVRVGQWLTPYGIWNVDHGSPTIVAVRRPLIVSQEVFPERQTGVQVHGRTYYRSSTFGYHLTVSNGRGPLSEYQDLDRNKAVGARLFYHYAGRSLLELGASVYRGRYTEREKQLGVSVVDGEVDVDLVSPVSVQFDEQAAGVDLRWQYRGLMVQSEVLFNDVAFTEGHRPPASLLLAPDGVVADYRTGGFYVLLGYRTPWLGIMPFVNYCTHSYRERDYLAYSQNANLGVNWRLEPNFVIKAEYGALYFDSAQISMIRNAVVQVAWAF